MSEQVKIAIAGVSGRMGQMLVKTVSENTLAKLAAVTERPGHEWAGQDLGVASGGSANSVPVFDNVALAVSQADVLIDFTAPQATLAHAKAADAAGCALVIGTTGFSEDELSELQHATPNISVVRAGNMSLGVNLLTQLTQKVAAALDEDFDIEVVEAHHRHKVDAPSGTALMLGQAAADGRGVNLTDAADRGRDGITGARERGKIGFHAIRGGDIVGEHDVMFAADGERIILRHIATDRAVFARGAVKAAIWAAQQQPGCYDMIDVLGL
ncbi:MAG: 4-hydroxy-tetrahydrodipicolinate reductase [Pseudomonadota bacterium]